jgi:hypothetical protein
MIDATDLNEVLMAHDSKGRRLYCSWCGERIVYAERKYGISAHGCPSPIEWAHFIPFYPPLIRPEHHNWSA